MIASAAGSEVSTLSDPASAPCGHDATATSDAMTSSICREVAIGRLLPSSVLGLQQPDGRHRSRDNKGIRDAAVGVHQSEPTANWLLARAATLGKRQSGNRRREMPTPSCPDDGRGGCLSIRRRDRDVGVRAFEVRALPLRRRGRPRRQSTPAPLFGRREYSPIDDNAPRDDEGSSSDRSCVLTTNSSALALSAWLI